MSLTALGHSGCESSGASGNARFTSKSLSASYTSADLLRILQDRKDGVCLTDFESALITRIFVLRAKGRPITRESVLAALA